MIKLVIGKRYKLPHGVGTLLGTESFDMHGNSEPMVPEIPLNWNERTRFLFQIDPESNWAQIMKTTTYAAWGKQIEEVKES